MLACVYVVSRIVNSRFGMVLRAAKSNEARTRAIGFSPYPYRLAAFVMAGAMRGSRARSTRTTPTTSCRAS